MATTVVEPITCSWCWTLNESKTGCNPNTSTEPCREFHNRGAGMVGTSTKIVDFSLLAATWIVNNNPNGVRSAMVAQGIIANGVAANAMSRAQLVSSLYNYSKSRGKAAYANLLRSITPNDNISASESQTLSQATNDIRAVASANNIMMAQPAGQTSATFREGDPSVAKKWWEELIEVIVGGSETVVPPVITTTTRTSPLAIGLIIGGVLVLGILAYVIVKR